MTVHEMLLTIGSSTATPAERNAAWCALSALLADERFAGFARRHGVDAELYADLRQDVLLALTRPATRYHGTGEPQAMAYLRAIVRFRAIDELRRRVHRQRVTVDSSVDDHPGFVEGGDRLAAADLRRRLDELVVRAGTLQDRPSAATLWRHLLDALFGHPIAGSAPGTDVTAAARLRKERQRSFELLRKAHAAVLGDIGPDDDRPDALDHALAAALAPRRP
jgi:DNA-directed RNA polymerase specialized sigma24 family protein